MLHDYLSPERFVDFMHLVVFKGENTLKVRGKSATIIVGDVIRHLISSCAHPASKALLVAIVDECAAQLARLSAQDYTDRAAKSALSGLNTVEWVLEFLLDTKGAEEALVTQIYDALLLAMKSAVMSIKERVFDMLVSVLKWLPGKAIGRALLPKLPIDRLEALSTSFLSELAPFYNQI